MTMGINTYFHNSEYNVKIPVFQYSVIQYSVIQYSVIQYSILLLQL